MIIYFFDELSDSPNLADQMKLKITLNFTLPHNRHSNKNQIIFVQFLCSAILNNFLHHVIL
jgi:hypothetical protein